MSVIPVRDVKKVSTSGSNSNKDLFSLKEASVISTTSDSGQDMWNVMSK
jgi:hypothetical protein